MTHKQGLISSDSSLVAANAVFDVQPAAPMAACYICRLTSVPGRFLPQKAKELGVPPGPLFGKLKAGIAVQGKDRLVQPDEVTLLPSSPRHRPLSPTCAHVILAFVVLDRELTTTLAGVFV